MAAEPTDYLALTAEHVKNPKADVVAAIVKYCGPSLHDRDGRYVAATDDAELERIVKGFCAKKLGLNAEAGAAAVAAAAASMKATRMKHRVPFYYLVAEHAGKLGALVGGAPQGSGAETPAKPASSTSSAAAMAPAAMTTAASVAAPKTEAPKAAAPAPQPAVRPAASAPTQSTAPAQASASAPKAAPAPSVTAPAANSGSGWWKWVLLLLAALAAIWFFTRHHDADDKTAAQPAAATTTTTTTTTAATPAAVVVDNVDVNKNVTTAMDTLTATLPTVTDAASANAALPKLQEAGAAITAVTGVASKFSADQKTAVASMVNAGLPALTGLVTKAETNADAAGVLKPVLDGIIANLTGLTK